MDYSTRPSNVRVYQFHHFGLTDIIIISAAIIKRENYL